MTNLVTTPEAYAQPKHRMNPPPAKQNGGTPEQAAAGYSLHPKAQEAAAIFSDAMRELENHREMVRAMQHRIDVQEATIRELQYNVDAERQMKERYQRYSVVVQTLIGSMARAAQQAHEAAADHAVREEPKQVAAPAPQKSQAEADVENALAELRATTQ